MHEVLTFSLFGHYLYNNNNNNNNHYLSNQSFSFSFFFFLNHWLLHCNSLGIKIKKLYGICIAKLNHN